MFCDCNLIFSKAKMLDNSEKSKTPFPHLGLVLLSFLLPLIQLGYKPIITLT
jgi:hypothetical protein